MNTCECPADIDGLEGGPDGSCYRCYREQEDAAIMAGCGVWPETCAERAARHRAQAAKTAGVGKGENHGTVQEGGKETS